MCNNFLIYYKHFGLPTDQLSNKLDQLTAEEKLCYYINYIIDYTPLLYHRFHRKKLIILQSTIYY